MIKHAVMIRLKEMSESEKRKKALELKNALEGLKEKIDVIKSIEVGINTSDRPIAFDLLAVSAFDSYDDLNHFRFHQAHLDVVEIIKPVEQQSILVDYEI